MDAKRKTFKMRIGTLLPAHFRRLGNLLGGVSGRNREKDKVGRKKGRKDRKNPC